MLYKYFIDMNIPYLQKKEITYNKINKKTVLQNYTFNLKGIILQRGDLDWDYLKSMFV